MKKGILFLTLNTFSATGGIEKVCRIAAKAFATIAAEQKEPFQLFSMHDRGDEQTDPYLEKERFKGAAGKKFSFVQKAVKRGRRSRVVVISHIHLALPAILIKIFSPRTRLIVMAHGIEVWKPLSAIQKRCLHKADKVVCVSNYTRNRLSKNIQLHSSLVINNCLDPYLPQPDTGTMVRMKNGWRIELREKVVMTLSRISVKERKKNFDRVIEALSLLPETAGLWKYLLVGRYTEEEKTRLENLARKYEVKKKLIFTGFVPDEDIGSVYALADVYVMPSEKEGFGISFIEAMHYGVPVIGGNADGSIDALMDGKLGLMINPENIDEIVSAITKVLQRPDDFKADEEVFNQHFGFNNYLENWRKILDFN